MHCRPTTSLLLLLLGLCGWLLAPACASAAEADTPVKATLLSDTTAVSPGTPFTIGVQLAIRPGWHIYWLFPGDSGMKTSVRFQAPPGFTVGDLRFPTPEQFADLDGSVFGYSGTVLLTAVVTPPSDPAQLAGDKAEFRAVASWLCCQKVCLPGTSPCELALPVGGEAKAANQALFEATAKGIPVALGQPNCPASGNVHGERAGETWTLTADLQWLETPAKVEFFPTPEGALKISDISVRNDGKHTLVSLKAQTLQGMTLSKPTLLAVIAGSDDHGARRGVQFHFDLK